MKTKFDDTFFNLIDSFRNDLHTNEMNNLKANDFTNITLTEIRIIECIGHTRKSMSEVARRMKVTIGSLTTSINKLVLKEYVTRAYNDKDRRKVILNLTKDGEKALKVHKNFYSRFLGHVAKNLESSENKVIEKFSQIIKDFFSNESGEVNE